MMRKIERTSGPEKLWPSNPSSPRITSGSTKLVGGGPNRSVWPAGNANSMKIDSSLLKLMHSKQSLDAIGGGGGQTNAETAVSNVALTQRSQGANPLRSLLTSMERMHILDSNDR